MKFKHAILAIIPVLFFCKPVQAQTKNQAIDEYVNDIVKIYDIFGGAIAIIQNDEVVYRRHFGISNIETQTLTNEKTIYQIFSTTKIFSTVAIHQLVEEQKLDLEDAIGQLLPDLPKEWQAIKIKHLLAHSSGLPDIRRYSEETETLAQEKVYGDPIQFHPGDRFSYNQTNYWLLNRIVKKVTRLDLEEVILKEQFSEQIETVVFNGDYNSSVPNRAITYAAYGPSGEREIAQYKIANFLYGASGMNISLEAFIEWDSAFSKNEIINPISKWRLFEPFTYSQTHKFAHGWDIVSTNGQVSYGFTGSGFTGYRRFPENNLSVIFLTNGSTRQMPINGFINELARIAMREGNQSEESLIRKTLMDYIEGTANGEPDKLQRAFHEDMNLYSIADDTLGVLSGKTYISYYQPGQKRDRIGKIISIDHVNDAAMAKLEIDYPSRRRLYTDYILLLRVRGQWKIIQKSYTSENY